MLEAGLDLLACPRCGGFLRSDDQVRCEQGHAYDVSRQGYLNLDDRAPPRNADTAAMVVARMAFLAGGHYEPVAAALIAAVPTQARTVLDAGAGTGHYAGRLLTARPQTRGVALDVSVAAVRRAAVAHDRLAAAVADVWRPLPVRTGVVDVVLSVFAPRNPAEFSRVLAPQGVLITVTPAPAHLAELRDVLGLLEHQDDKAERLVGSLADHFAPDEQLGVEVSQLWDRATARASVLMGPNAFHLDAATLDERLAGVGWPRPVTVAVRVDRWRRTREEPPGQRFR